MPETAIDSKLPEAHERFVAKYLTRLKQSGLITPAMLYETFTPERLYDGYAQEVESRGKVLVLTGRLTAEYAGAFDKSAFSQIVGAAVKIGDIKLESLFQTVSADELVRVHDRKELYALMELTAWFEKDTPAHREIAAHLLTDYVAEKLGGAGLSSLHDLERVFSFELYVKHLPSEVLVAILKSARGNSDGGNGHGPGGVKFSADVLAETATPAILAKHMPLDLVQKLVESAAIKYGYKDPPKLIDVPRPPVDALPPEALDSIAPPPPSDPPKADSDDPEVAISSGGEGGAMDLELDGIDDGSTDEPTMVVSADDVGKKERDKSKQKGPPPLRGR